MFSLDKPILLDRFRSNQDVIWEKSLKKYREKKKLFETKVSGGKLSQKPKEGLVFILYNIKIDPSISFSLEI